jgi:hypothetical protein
LVVGTVADSGLASKRSCITFSTICFRLTALNISVSDLNVM